MPMDNDVDDDAEQFEALLKLEEEYRRLNPAAYDPSHPDYPYGPSTLQREAARAFADRDLEFITAPDNSEVPRNTLNTVHPGLFMQWSAYHNMIRIFATTNAAAEDLNQILIPYLKKTGIGVYSIGEGDYEVVADKKRPGCVYDDNEDEGPYAALSWAEFYRVLDEKVREALQTVSPGVATHPAPSGTG